MVHRRKSVTRLRRVLNVAIAAVLVAILAAVYLSLEPAPGADPIIDSWPIGPARGCDLDAARCDARVLAGLAGLDGRDPGHGAVDSWELHVEGAFSDALSGQRRLVNRSGGCCQVLVMKLTDGSTRAIGVGYDFSDTAVAVPREARP